METFQKGQTLIETLASLAILSIVITAITISVVTSLRNTEYNQNQTLSVKYAQQGSEIIQQLRDYSYTNFKNNYAGLYCLGKGQTTLGVAQTQCTTPNVDNFIRSVNIQQGGCAANVAKVTVSVSYTDQRCAVGVYCHNQLNVTCLSTVNPIQNP